MTPVARRTPRHNNIAITSQDETVAATSGVAWSVPVSVFVSVSLWLVWEFLLVQLEAPAPARGHAEATLRPPASFGECPTTPAASPLDQANIGPGLVVSSRVRLHNLVPGRTMQSSLALLAYRELRSPRQQKQVLGMADQLGRNRSPRIVYRLLAPNQLTVVDYLPYRYLS
ncbi:hypothetical protein Micbo1qcDRAFT_176927 [Microdochium bolleyi]|uniref:Uncharacterized protein n=1 Tax=Microdochium bolleyi TaxID=196109 RepID=A0A136IXP7_9PEZI|nr:hypothetical protein Micbo1qcDRAFT_176927 [Microdochium bolleyi]